MVFGGEGGREPTSEAIAIVQMGVNDALNWCDSPEKYREE